MCCAFSVDGELWSLKAHCWINNMFSNKMSETAFLKIYYI